MSIELIPYLLLLATIILGWKSSARNSLVCLAAAVVAALALGRLSPLALAWIGLAGLSIWLPLKHHVQGLLGRVCLGVFFIFAVALSIHRLPGFHNLVIFKRIQFSTDSIPFTMYLNFDKTIIGIFIYLFFLKPNQPAAFTQKHLLFSAQILAALLILMIPAGLAIRFVRLDPKFENLGWLWMMNNLFFVCLAEEALFRGFIQKGLINVLPKAKIWSVVSVLAAAILFGLAHFQGGINYILLATIAGVFYGCAYQRTNRIESPMLVHFGLNLIHFLFFSYPALAAGTF